jgi:outer membrane protein, heavy metal efflux system
VLIRPLISIVMACSRRALAQFTLPALLKLPALFALITLLAHSALLTALTIKPVRAQSVSAAPEMEALSLQRAQEIQRDSNRSIRTALRQSEIAATEVYRVNVRPNPSLTAQVSNTEPNRYRPGSTDRILRLDQLIERGGKRELRTRQAQLLEQASKRDLADVIRQQNSQLAQAYFELVAAQDSHALALENLAGYQRLLSAAERRANAGDLASIDVSRLRVEAGRSANELRAALAQIQQAQVNLAAVLGRESSAMGVRAIDPLPEKDTIDAQRKSIPQSFEQLEALLQSRRADISAARLRTEAAEQGVGLAQSLRARDVSVGLQTERSPAFGGHVFGISATLPLFVNNDFAGDVSRALAEKDAADEELTRLKAQIRIDLERASSSLSAAADRALRLYAHTLPDAAKVVSALEFAFSKGAATLIDLFDARRQSAAVRADAIAARLEFAKAYASYQAATTLENLP